MSFNLISKLGYSGYNREVRHETFCMNLPFITTKITGIDNQLLEKHINFIDDTYQNLKNPIEGVRKMFGR